MNGDGQIDILLRGRFTLDSSNNLIPPLQSIILFSDGNGSYYIDSAPSRSLLSSRSWTKGSYELLPGDFQGDGLNDLLIRSLNLGNSSFTLKYVLCQPVPTLLQEIKPAEFGIDFGDAGIDVAITDTNGDNRSDIQVYQDGQQLAVLLADPNGIFTPIREVLINETLEGLRNALSNNNASAALQFFSVTAQEKYSQIFTDLGAEIATIPDYWSSATPISIGDNFAEYAVRQTIDGQTRLHLIRFIRDDQGRWLIEDM